MDSLSPAGVQPSPYSAALPQSVVPLTAPSLTQTAPVPLSVDRLQPSQAGKRGALEAVKALWQDPPPVTPQDKTWAAELVASTRRGHHPSVDEMERYRQVTQSSPPSAAAPAVYTLAEVTPVMKAIFSRLDKNGNGFLGDKELKAAIRSPGFKGTEAVSLAVLHKLNHSIEKLSWNEWKQSSGVTKKDLTGLARKATQDKPSRWTLFVESYVFNQSLRLRQTEPKLFPKGIESIRPDHISQGDYGTCTILAAASALAATPRGKQAIFEMISEKADGSFEVRFPGEPALSVRRPTDTELILYASAGADGLWLSVLEKAFVARMEKQLAGKSEDEVETAVNGGLYLSAGISLLTGKPAVDGSVPDTPLPQLRAFVAENVKAGRILLATLDPDSPQAKDKTLKQKTQRSESIYADGLVGLHAYSVIGYDPAQDRITLHNPWGHTEYGSDGKAADGVNDGVFSLPLAEFHRLFSNISWQSS